VKVLDGVSLLLVDAHPQHRQVLCRQLRRWGVDVWSALNVAIALELCRERGKPAFDFILLDEQMPDMDTEEFLQALQQEPNSEGMMRIMLTSMQSTCDRRRLEDLGLAQCLSKPIVPTELWCILNTDKPDDNDCALQITPQPQQSLPGFDLQMFAEAPYILFVEDNEMNQLVLQELAKLFQIEGEAAWHGEDCLEILKESANNPAARPFSLVIMDCMMPKMDGYEATRRIRAGEAGDHYQSIPIIAMTANAMSGDEERCLAAGMNDYLMKPIEIDDLSAVLKKWLPKKSD
jgi:CheY-like chemotaxis protein